MEFFSIECFITVVRTGSFTRASEVLGRTQSAISQQIAKIESQLAKKLLNRAKIITLTPDGEYFYAYAKQIYDLQKEVQQHFLGSQIDGEVKFGLPEDFIAIFLDSVLSEFTQIYPNVVIKIECDLSLHLLERFHQHEFDMILLKVDTPESFNNSQEVWSERLEWVASKLFYQKYTEKDHSLPLVLSPPPCLYRSRALKALEDAKMDYRIVFTSSSYHSKVAAVKAGLGLTLLPVSMIPQHLFMLDRKKLSLPLLHDTHVSLLRHNLHDPIIQTFGDFVIKKLKH